MPGAVVVCCCSVTRASETSPGYRINHEEKESTGRSQAGVRSRSRPAGTVYRADLLGSYVHVCMRAVTLSTSEHNRGGDKVNIVNTSFFDTPSGTLLRRDLVSQLDLVLQAESRNIQRDRKERVLTA